jgi:DNA-binding MarR family transcriptional regulator
MSRDITPRLSYLIGRLDRIVGRELEAVLVDADLSLPQYTAMSVLRARPGLSNAQLARRSLVTPQAMNQALAGLAKRDLIKREAHPTEGRVLTIELTATGEELLAAVEPGIDSAEDQILKQLDKRQRAKLLSLLEAIADIGSP